MLNILRNPPFRGLVIETASAAMLDSFRVRQSSRNFFGGATQQSKAFRTGSIGVRVPSLWTHAAFSTLMRLVVHRHFPDCRRYCRFRASFYRAVSFTHDAAGGCVGQSMLLHSDLYKMQSVQLATHCSLKAAGTSCLISQTGNDGVLPKFVCRHTASQ